MKDHYTALYNISVVARLTGLHEQTIRQYERLGLIKPQRTPGGTRSFSEADIDRLQAIANLTRQMGVNLAGVELILRMRDSEQRLLELLREVLSQLDDETRRRFEALLLGNEPGLVMVPKGGLVHAEPASGDKEKKGPRRIEIKGE